MNKIIRDYKGQGHRIILSLTTTPSRQPYVPLLLKEYVDTSCFDEIVINIPNFYKNDSTSPKYKPIDFKNKKVTINPIRIDLGPLSKIVPTVGLRKNKEDIIVSIDDDIHIPKRPNVLVNLVCSCILHDEVVTGVGKNLKHWRLHVDQWSIPKAPHVQLVEGWTGVAYKRKMIDPIFLQSLVLSSKKCALSDDLVISYSLFKAGHQIRSLQMNENKFKEMEWGLGEDAIHLHTKRHEQANYENYAKCLRHIQNIHHKTTGPTIIKRKA